MKIAVSAVEASAEALVDQRFGRAKAFMLFDSDTNTWQPLENTTQLNAAQGAGIQAAEMLARSGVGVVLTGHCGPKAFRTLSAAGIEVFTEVNGTVSEAVDAYLSGKLTAASGPDVEGHWV